MTPPSAPLFHEVNLLPGDTIQHTLTIENEDLLNACNLHVEVEDIEDLDQLSLELFTGIQREGVNIYGTVNLAGKATADKTWQDVFATVAPGVPLESIPANTTRIYQWMTTFNPDAGNAYQLTEVQFDLPFHFTCDEAPIPTPSPSPSTPPIPDPSPVPSNVPEVPDVPEQSPIPSNVPEIPDVPGAPTLQIIQGVSAATPTPEPSPTRRPFQTPRTPRTGNVRGAQDGGQVLGTCHVLQSWWWMPLLLQLFLSGYGIYRLRKALLQRGVGVYAHVERYLVWQLAGLAFLSQLAHSWVWPCSCAPSWWCELYWLWNSLIVVNSWLSRHWVRLSVVKSKEEPQ